MDATNLKAMVSCCFNATPSNSVSGSDDEMYMTQQGSRRATTLPWFLRSDGTPSAAANTTITSSLEDILTSDRTMIGPSHQEPPRWLKDDIFDYCMQCERKFDLFTRKHHCRACGRVCCTNCTSQKEHVIQYGFPDPVRVCLPCSIEARVQNEFYEHHLPLLEQGAVFVKYGVLVNRLVEFKFIRSRLIFQYQTLDNTTRAPQNDFKAFTLDSITDVKQVPIDKENGMLGLLILIGTNEEHRLDAATSEQRQQWINAMQCVRGIRRTLLEKERDRRAKQMEMQNTEMMKMTASLRKMEAKKASFHEDRLSKRAEQREILRAKYQLSSSSMATTTTAAS